MADRPGLMGAAGTLELLLQVMKGETAAIEYVEPYLHSRSQTFEKHEVQGGVFDVKKPTEFASHGSTSGPSVMPVKPNFRGPELMPGAREAAGMVHPSQRERPPPGAGGSNVLRGAGTAVAGKDGQLRPAPQPTATGTITQSRSTGSLQQSGSNIVGAGNFGGSEHHNKHAGPGRHHASSSGTIASQDVDKAYANAGPPDLDALRARLSAVIDSKSSTGASASKAKGTGGLGSTASTTLPQESRRAMQGTSGSAPRGSTGKDMLLAGSDTPLTARSEDSEFAGVGAFNIVNDIVDTCVELEHTQISLKRTDPKLLSSRSVASMSSPSQIWTTRAALAAAASAEAASAAAEVAAAASAEAAREAAKCVAAAKAATGRYNHLVDYVMSARDITMAPGQKLPALKDKGDDSDTECTSKGKVCNRMKKKTGEDHAADEAGAAQTKKKLEQKTAALKPHTYGMDDEVNLQEFKLVVSFLELDAHEARNIFLDICDEQKVERDETRTFALEEYLEALHMDPEDREGTEKFIEGLKKAREEVAKNPNIEEFEKKEGSLKGEARVRQMFDKLLRHMAYAEVTKKGAWAWIQKKIKEQDADPKKQIISYAEVERLKSYDKDMYMQIFEGYWETPPVINASGGQVGCKEVCTRVVNDIIKDCQAKGTQWTDPDWDMKKNPTAVLYVDKKEPGFDCTVAPPASFRRMSHIVKDKCAGGTAGAMNSMFGGFAKKPAGAKKGTKPMLFKGGVEAGDIVQGQIGTCFLLGAIGAMASHRGKALPRIFIKYDVDVGVYGVRFNLDGEWTYVVVDDWMPVDECGDLLYASCKDPQEVWVPILEKAFCKLHTCYEMCDGGEGTEALNAFFGGVTGKLHIDEQHHKNPSKFFNVLKNARDKGWLCTTSFVMQPGAKPEGSGKCGEDMLPCGLVGGHAYSVLKICEAEGNQLVQCRNPWGTGEWTGAWGDKDPAWTPSMKKAAGAALVDDGKFWMSIHDFVNNSGGVSYARTFGPNWKKCTRYSRFASVPLIGTAKRDFKGRRPDNLSFKKGDEIVIKEIQGEIGYGHHKGQPKALGTFLLKMVKMNERPVLRFDLVADADPQDKDQHVTAVVMLMQHNVIMQRKFKASQQTDNMNYKDTNYANMQLIIVDPKGKVAFKQRSDQRCIWTEVEMAEGGTWKVYALCNSGKGAPAIARCYLKGGILSKFNEAKGVKYSELAQILADDDD